MFVLDGMDKQKCMGGCSFSFNTLMAGRQPQYYKEILGTHLQTSSKSESIGSKAHGIDYGAAKITLALVTSLVFIYAGVICIIKKSLEQQPE